jgi:dynein heavy chain
MLDCQNKQIEIVKAYGIQNFRDFIKTLKLLTGVEGKECTFLFTDTQIIKEQFLEDINSLLNSGEVPNLWEPEEKKQILDSTRDYNTKIGRIGLNNK